MKKRKNKNKYIIILLIAVIMIVSIYMLKGNESLANGNIQESTTEQASTDVNIKESTTEQTSTEDATITEEPKTQTIIISAVGDIIYHMSQIQSAYNSDKGTYDFNRYFELIKPIIESSDIAIGNFEGTTAGTKEYAYMAYPRFNAPDEVLDAIKYAGFDVISTVNNHSIDTGKNGIIRTLEEIKKRGMLTVGTNAGSSSEYNQRVIFVEEKGIKIAFIAYTFGCNGMETLLTPEELNNMVNIIDKSKILQDIEYAKNNNADMITAFMHWGTEYQRDPSATQRELADFMFTNGVDIVLGSHPHVIQDSKILEYNGEKKFIIYSMGNFISNQRQESLDSEYPNLDNFYTEDGVIVNIEIEKNFETNQTVINQINFIPTWVNRIKTAPLYDYDVIPVELYLKNNPLGLDEYTLSRMERSYKNTMIKMNMNFQ